MKTAMKKLFSLVLVAVLLIGVMPFQAFAASAPYYQIISPSENNKVLESVGNLEVRAYEQSEFSIPSGYTFDYATKNGNPTTFPVELNEGDVLLLLVNPVVEEHTHSYTGTVTTEASCTAEGVKTFTCSCGDSYTEAIAALGHNEVTDAAVDATCTETGLTEGSHCSRCAEVFVAQETIPSLGHNYVNGECTNCGLCYTCKADPCTCVKDSYTVTINLNKNGTNSTFSRTYQDGTELTLNEALVNEVDFGSATVAWIVDGVSYASHETVTVNGNMTISCSITANKSEAKTITLNANGGRLQTYETKSYTVVIGEPYGNLPTPTRSGYEFAYWYYKNKAGNEVRVGDSTIVETTNTLYAKWIANGMTVTFQRYDMMEGWVDVEEHTVPVNSKLTIEDGTFPSSSRIDVVYDISGFEIIGWKVVETGATFKEDSTKVTANITLRPRYEGTVKLVAQEPVTGDSWKTYTKTVVIGETIGKLTNPGSRSTYSFNGWLASNGSDEICDSSCKSTLKYYPHLYGTSFYVKWAGGVTVRLHIHTNGNTASASKIIPYYVAPAEGEFNLKNVNLYSLYSSYYKYDDDCDKSYGWYDAEQWKNYCANRASHPATVFTDIEANGQYDFHIMLINNGDDSSSSSSSSSSGTADSSNPKTGDMIFTPVIIMGASVMCLAALFFLNKKRAY